MGGGAWSTAVFLKAYSQNTSCTRYAAHSHAFHKSLGESHCYINVLKAPRKTSLKKYVYCCLISHFPNTFDHGTHYIHENKFSGNKKVAYSIYVYFQCKTEINRNLSLDFGYLSHSDTTSWLGKGSCSSVTLWLYS